MATIRFRRGETDPIASIQPTGLTMGEPVFNRKLNKFWVGGSGPAGFTAIWVGAEIENTIDWSTPSQYKLATQYAIDQRVKQIIGASAGVQSIAGLSGIVSLVFGTGISGSTSAGAITLQNTGVTRLGLSGDWRTRGVTNFGGAATGGVTLASEVWQGSANPVLNTITTWGITAGTVLTGKTPMEILEIMLFQYLNPSISWGNNGMGFVASYGSATTRNFAFGITADSGTFQPQFSAGNTSNFDLSKGITISATITSNSGMVGQAGVIQNNIFASLSSTNNLFPAFSLSPAYKGTSYSSGGNAQATFTLSATSTQGTVFNSTSITYSWHPRAFFGRSNNPSLIYPLDAWKPANTSAPPSTGTGKLISSGIANDPQAEIEFAAGNNDEFLYFFIDSFYSPIYVRDKASGQDFALLGGGTANTEVQGITLDDGFTTRTYRRYRSLEPQTSAYTLKLTNT